MTDNSFTCYIVLPVYNRFKVTRSFIEHFLCSVCSHNVKLIIVDASSPDHTFDLISAQFQQDNIHIYSVPSTYFWTQSIFFGLSTFISYLQPYDRIIFMNDDITFDSQFLQCLIDLSLDNPTSILSPLSVHGSIVTSKASLLRYSPLAYFHKPVHGLKITELPDSFVEVDFLPANATIFPASVLSRIGLPQFNFLPHYHADGDFFYRAKKAGYPLLLCTNLFYIRSSDTTGPFNSKNTSSLSSILSSYFDIRSANYLPSLFYLSLFIAGPLKFPIFFLSLLTRALLRSLLFCFK